MPGAVGDEVDELGVVVSGPGTQAVKKRTDRAGKFKVGALALRTDDVAAASAGVKENGFNRAAVILNLEPVADVEARAVGRNGLMGQTFADHGRNELFGVLPGAEVV